MIRVLVVDDHSLVRETFRMILDIVPDIDVVGEAEDGFDALDALARCQPDVVVMDISMPSLNGFDTLERMKKQVPDIRVVLVTAHDDDQYERVGRRIGAAAFIRKEAAGRQLVPAIYG